VAGTDFTAIVSPTSTTGCMDKMAINSAPTTPSMRIGNAVSISSSSDGFEVSNLMVPRSGVSLGRLLFVDTRPNVNKTRFSREVSQRGITIASPKNEQTAASSAERDTRHHCVLPCAGPRFH
jgi:hypothetical protein